MPKVKICGITNAQDALWAVNLGADFIGLNFYPPSPRKVSVKHAKELAAQVPPFVGVVGVFVDEPLESVKKIVKSVPLKIVQVHGNETPEYCRAVQSLGVKVIKAVRVQKPLETVDTEPFLGAIDYFLFDAYVLATPGGTGETFNWEWLQPAAQLTKPWFLAGGLTAENVADAIQSVHPSMVDACSGIERTPSRKDYDAMKKFIQTAKALR